MSDGVSLRNFAYSSFYQIGIEKGYEIVFWNNTPFDLKKMGFKEIPIQNPKISPLTDILKAAQIRIELGLFAKRDSDNIYHEYVFPLSFKSLKSSIRSLLILGYKYIYASEKGLVKIRKRITELESKTPYYLDCKKVLEDEQPDLVFSTSQRSVVTIAPLEAAKTLNIPTASFIFSWDNVPKATTVVTTDYYFVWSEHMKKELLHYQRYIKDEQVKITGTPQFENHFNPSFKETKESFFAAHGLDISKKYICFSGDDFTTSPKDELYLRDLAKAVRELNSNGYELGVIFRRSPADFSNRYDAVIEEYKEIIVPIAPIWKQIGGEWNTIFPTMEDMKLQTNVIAHSEAVVNLGSSMVFDYASYKKPCVFINYNYLNPSNEYRDGVYVYDFVHFRSMPSSESVIWISKPDMIGKHLREILDGQAEVVDEAIKWFKIINQHPPQEASLRIWNSIDKIIS